MKHKFLGILLFVIPALLPGQSNVGAPSLAITHVSVFDANEARLQKDRTVIIEGGQITTVEPAMAAKVPRETKIIDGRGKYLIPGLWDMHVHLSTVSEGACPALVANGVTGVRDMGGDLEIIDWMRERIANGTIVGPQIFRAGPFVDGSKPGIPHRLVVWNASDAREAVSFLKMRDVDFIKTHTATPPEAYFALVEHARKQGLTVVGHIPMDVNPTEAIEAGQHCVEHIVALFEGPFTKLVKSGKSQEQAMSEFPDDYFIALARRMVAKKTWFDPTLIAYWTRSYQWDLKAQKDPREKYVTASAKEYWKTIPELPDDPEKRKLLASAYERFSQITGVMKREGVRFLVGTDLAARYIYPGFSVHDELQRLVKAGLSPAETLQAATRNCAESLGVLDRVGTIEQGKSADLVLLDADPIENIANTKKILAVIREGRLYSRSDLDTLLQEVAANAPNR